MDARLFLMRQDSAIIIAKGAAHILVGAFTPWAAALAQWSNSGETPSTIVWVGVIAPASIVGGASALLSFLSGAYAEYVKNKEPRQAIADEAAAKIQALKEKAKIEHETQLLERKRDE